MTSAIRTLRARRAKRPTRRRAAVVAVALLALPACSGTPAAPSTAPLTADGQGAEQDDGALFPLAIDHALGQAVIPDPPERVVTLGWGAADTAIALGVVPVGMPIDTYAGGEDGITPWVEDALADLGAPTPTLYVDMPEVDVEEIAVLEPDVILAPYSGITEDVYAQLEALAPTVAYPKTPWLTPWPEQTLLTGKALGLEAEAQQLVDSIHQMIADAAADHPELDGRTFAYVYAGEPGQLQAYLPGDPRVDVLTELGMELAPQIAGLEPVAGQFVADIGLENVELLDDVDVVITWFVGADQQQEMEGQALFQQIPAVERGSYVALTDPALNFSVTTVTALGLPWGLEQFLPLLADAAGRV